MPTDTYSPVQAFEYLERKPHPSWFVQARNDFGHKELFLVLEVTGLYPRRYGPFDSETEAMEFLNDFLSRLTNAFCENRSNLGGDQREVIKDALATRPRRRSRAPVVPLPRREEGLRHDER